MFAGFICFKGQPHGRCHRSHGRKDRRASVNRKIDWDRDTFMCSGCQLPDSNLHFYCQAFLIAIFKLWYDVVAFYWTLERMDILWNREGWKIECCTKWKAVTDKELDNIIF